jgi:hypothetical protein
MGHAFSHWPILYKTGGSFGVAGDYLFRDYAPSGARNGMFGILRAEGTNSPPPPPPDAGGTSTAGGGN